MVFYWRLSNKTDDSEKGHGISFDIIFLKIKIFPIRSRGYPLDRIGTTSWL